MILRTGEKMIKVGAPSRGLLMLCCMRQLHANHGHGRGVLLILVKDTLEHAWRV